MMGCSTYLHASYLDHAGSIIPASELLSRGKSGHTAGAAWSSPSPAEGEQLQRQQYRFDLLYLLPSTCSTSQLHHHMDFKIKHKMLLN